MSDCSNEDILGHILAMAMDGWDESTQEFNMVSVFSLFKTLYFASQDSMLNLLTFAMLMLVLHSRWQERA